MAFYYSPRIVTDGLVMCLDPNNPKSYSGSGTNFIDISYSSHNHSINNSPTFNSTIPCSFTLNGSNQGFTITDPISNISLTSTVTLYVKTSDTMYLWVMGNSNGNYYLSADYGAGYYSGNCGSPSYYVDLQSATYQPHDGVWHMLEAKNIDFTGWSRFDWFLYGGGWQLAGQVGMMLVYDRNLTADESAQNFYAFKSRYGI